MPRHGCDRLVRGRLPAQPGLASTCAPGVPFRIDRPPAKEIVVSASVGPMPSSILGTRVVRVEDPDLIMGRGSFVDDVAAPGLTHLAFVRSPVAHARILGIDTAEAARQPGVLAVLTAADLAKDGIGPFHPVMVP